MQRLVGNFKVALIHTTQDTLLNTARHRPQLGLVMSAEGFGSRQLELHPLDLLSDGSKPLGTHII